MAEFKVNKEMFGKYVMIPTGYSKDKHIYKVVSVFYSNSYCDVPIVHGSEPKSQKVVETKENPYGLETVLNVIHCGIDETKVIRVALKDCEIVEPKTNADKIRSLSDEELADMIIKFHIDEEIPFCKNNELCNEMLKKAVEEREIIEIK